MTSLALRRFAACASTPWANGGGSTRVLADDAPSPGGEWTYRVSVADLVGAQPFSRFPGIHRHLTFLGPGTLSLRIAGEPFELRPLEAIRFEGEDDVSSEPSVFPARDLNVMSRRGRSRATVRRTGGSAAIAPSPDVARTLWIALEDGCTVDGQPAELLDSAWLPRDRPTQVQGRAMLVDLS